MPGLTGGRPLSWTVSTAVCVRLLSRAVTGRERGGCYMVEEARDCQAGEGARQGPPGESGDFSFGETFRLCREWEDSEYLSRSGVA